jgi:hypothetical protein
MESMSSRWIRMAAVAASFALVTAFAVPDDQGLGKKKGGGGNNSGGNSGGTKAPPPPPPRVENPPRQTGGGTRTGSQIGGEVGSGSTGGSISGGRTTIGGGDDALGRRRPAQQPSRSGTVQYGTIHNQAQRAPAGPVTFGERPSDFSGVLGRQVRQTEARVGLSIGPVRLGYYHYNRQWRDDWFWYPHYAFDPYSFDRFVCSPWYYYPTLPPYLRGNRVMLVNVFPSYGWTGVNYRWTPPDRYDRWGQYSDLDHAVGDIVTAFERNDRRAAGRLIPRGGTVNIYMSGRYEYSLRPDDFYDLFMDAIDNTRTLRYRVTNVQTGRDSARVTARHDYQDPWGRNATVWHHYFLEMERNNIVIREFGTSQSDRVW